MWFEVRAGGLADGGRNQAQMWLRPSKVETKITGKGVCKGVYKGGCYQTNALARNSNHPSHAQAPACLLFTATIAHRKNDDRAEDKGVYSKNILKHLLENAHPYRR